MGTMHDKDEIAQACRINKLCRHTQSTVPDDECEAVHNTQLIRPNGLVTHKEDHTEIAKDGHPANNEHESIAPAATRRLKCVSVELGGKIENEHALHIRSIMKELADATKGHVHWLKRGSQSYKTGICIAFES
uniref:AlNc14C255G9709 protein n=1 Tax=Albugo laibachii Nc14 TaxID=890382 RepID=F0WTN2_9STRA|nr:AlNc14C255G9709 [Albugo laibachii Nc14]|eukprot:CCA24724.1 AlNc14C255G9709 [Albugo laibachii Nc14]